MIESLLDNIYYMFGIGKKAKDKRFKEKVRKIREAKDENCAKGRHVPVRAYSGNDPNIFSDDDEYFCQECCKTMTQKDHETFFSTPEMKKMREDRIRLLGY